MSRPAFRPLCEPLETRLVPAALLGESFEGARGRAVPVGWQASGAGFYVSTRMLAADGVQSIASTGTAAADNRLYTTDSFPADASVSAKLRADSPAPVEVVARGTDMATPRAEYLAATVSPGVRRVTLSEVAGQTRTELATLAVPSGVNEGWMTVTVRPAGSAVAARVQRLDTGAFLSPAGTWQETPADALTAVPARPAAPGQAGVARRPGGAGLALFDSFRIESGNAPVAETFDTTAAAARPAGWAGWATDGAGFVTTGARALGAGNGFATNGGSRTQARAWPTAAQPADVRATAAVYADTLIPAGVVVRGSGLDGATPSYYAATVVRGSELTILKVVDGVETVLSSVKSKSYTSGLWLNVTLAADGDRLRALVSRTDTGDYLDADGAWQSVPQPALEVADESIPGGGLVGVVRRAGAGGTVTVDDFRASATEGGTAVAVSVTPSQPADAVVGDVLFTASATPGAGVRRVEFRVDGRLRSAASTPGAGWALDTTGLTNGSHTLVVRAITEDGNAATTTLPFTVMNPVSVVGASSAIPRHYSHIRLAALAYSGNPLGEFERARLADSVDLVVPNTRYSAAIDAAAPATPQLVYSNISNLYQDLLPDWLGHAARTGASREEAFFHAARATPFTGGSPSSQPVTYFWKVTRDGADVTPAARGGRLTGADFSANVGGSLTVAHVDRFREVNVVLDRPASAGWQGVWEYASAVDAAGNPTAWATLNLLSDDTAGLTANGRVTFDPPRDWAAGGLYAVRVRTTAGGVAPVARTLLGRDYVGANGTTAGVIPAFDAAADGDGDGYLNDAEYAARAAGKDARFVHESRVFYPYYGQMRFAVNPAGAAVRAWAADVHARLLQANPLSDGVFLDNSNGRLPVAGVPVLEPTASYTDDYAALVRAVRRALPGKYTFLNTAGGRADADPVAAAAHGAFEEFQLRPTEATWAAVNDTLSLVAGRLAASDSSYLVLDSHPGSLPVASDRVRSGTLAYYYLAADPERTMLMTAGGYSPAAAWRNAWIDSVGTDVGAPQGPATVWASGADPTDAALTYKVFRRDYANAVVLYKPRSYAVGKTPGTVADATATTHDLGGTFRVLNPDNTQGPLVTRVTLRNGEGVVLMRA